MSGPNRERIVEALLERHGRTYAAELGIDLAKGTPSPLFRWLCASILLSARIGADIALAAAKALAGQGWTTAEKMAAASWEQRTRTLNQAGYARYDESTSRMLGATAELLIVKYGGDLRQLREAAERAPEREHALLQDCKGMGAVGADIFCREAQLAWEELYPFVDERALDAARHLGLEDHPIQLARHVPQKEFPRLVAALVRASLAKDFESVLEASTGR